MRRLRWASCVLVITGLLCALCPLGGAQAEGFPPDAWRLSVLEPGTAHPSVTRLSASESPTIGVSVTPLAQSVAIATSAQVTLLATAPSHGLGAWTVDVTYDPTVLTLTGVAGDNGSVVNAVYGPDAIRVTGSAVAGLSGTQPLATMTFSAAALGSSSLTPTIVTFTDPTGEPIASSAAVGGTLTVTPPLPAVTGLSQPAGGPASGGTVVTVFGSNLTGANAVQFGSIAAASFAVLSDSRLVAVSPPGSGVVDITVTGPGGVSATSSADQFTYLASPPSGGFPGASIVPSSIPVAPRGTATVTLQATAPSAGLGAWTVDVQYGPAVLSVSAATGANGTVCNPSYSTDTVRCAGASSAGLTGTNPLASLTFQAVGAAKSTSPLTVSLVTFTDPSGNPISATPTSGQVQVAPPPTVSGITPPAGRAGGGKAVTVRGSDFLPGATLTIGGSAASNVSVVSTTTITATTPPHGVLGDVTGSGTVTAVDALCLLRAVAVLAATSVCATAAGMVYAADVTVTNPDGQSASLAGSFTYHDFNVSGTDGGTPSAVDALCTLRIVAALPFTSACLAPTG